MQKNSSDRYLPNNQFALSIICCFQRIFLILGSALDYRPVSKGDANSLEHGSMNGSEFVPSAGTGNGEWETALPFLL